MRSISAALNKDPEKRRGPAVPQVRPHDLRRTHGTTIAALGFGRDAMNRIQNHVEGGIGSVYDRHEYAEENKRIMNAVAQRIMMLVEGDDLAASIPRGKNINSARPTGRDLSKAYEIS